MRAVPVSEHARERTLPHPRDLFGAARSLARYGSALRQTSEQMPSGAAKWATLPGLGGPIVPERTSVRLMLVMRRRRLGSTCERERLSHLGGVKSTEPRPHGRGTVKESR